MSKELKAEAQAASDGLAELLTAAPEKIANALEQMRQDVTNDALTHYGDVQADLGNLYGYVTILTAALAALYTKEASR